MSANPQTIVLQVDPVNPQPECIQQAAEVLRAGRLVAFPTETVYGLGANALDSKAIERIFWAKQRPANDPIIAHIHDTSQMQQIAIAIPPIAYQLATRFWPGPLTLVLQRAPHIPATIAAGLDTVAVRMPAHPVARTLLKTAALPVAAPSANTFTRPSATTAAHVLEDLKGRVDLILDAGPTTIGVESTVLDLTRTVPVVLRPGGVVLSDLRALIPDVQLAPRYLHNEAAPAPGQMLKHYSPRAQVLLYSGSRDAVLNAINVRLADLKAQGQRTGLLVADEDIDELSEAAAVESLGSIHDLPAISQKLFAGLRALDAVGVDFILTRDFGRQGLGAAIWDRLLRAAEGQVIAVE